LWPMKRFLKTIDTISEKVGSAGRWLVIALVAVTVYDVIARYVFDSPTIWGYQASTMLGGGVILAGWAYCQLHESHVRVDVLYARLAPKRRALIDVLGALICVFPMFIVFGYIAGSWAVKAMMTGEIMEETIWYPPSWPFRLAVLTGAVLLLLQVLATFIRDLQVLFGREDR